MDASWLADQLAAGRSMESIAREVGMHSSTVAYWAAKAGVTSTRAARHRARGALPQALLEPLVVDGLSVRQIAVRVDRSPTTVRHWLREYRLRTSRARRRSESVGQLPGADIELACPRHGPTLHRARAAGGYRCLRCRSQAVSDHRRRVKALLVAEAGGCGRRCGYAGHPAALHFHHHDPGEKEFHVALRGATRSLDRIRDEVRKCVLLCANCHAEIEASKSTI